MDSAVKAAAVSTINIRGSRIERIPHVSSQDDYATEAGADACLTLHPGALHYRWFTYAVCAARTG